MFLFRALVALAFFVSVANATQYKNNDGSVSPGYVPEINGRVVGPDNPLPSEDAEFIASLKATEFNASTAMQANANNNIMSGKLCNAAGSGVLVTIIQRRFDNNLVTGQIPAEYYGIASPGALPATGIVTSGSSTGTNLYGGRSSSSAVTFTWSVASSPIAGTVTAGGALPTGGMPLLFVKTRPVPPGQCFAQVVTGQNQPSGLGSVAMRSAITIFWIETPYIPLP